MKLVILKDVFAFLEKISTEEYARIVADLQSLVSGETSRLIIKPLHGKIMELSAGQSRIIFCRMEMTIYAMIAFKKQSKKTPLRILRRAEKIFQIVKNFP
jgi:phage-related protein